MGIFGSHRFYVGNTGMGLGMMFTFGGLGFWALFDVFAIGKAY
ncbi:NINE protein [Bacillus haynesii]|nr:TM2 domain-containing protein [Bacillus haynesii]